MTVRTAAIGLVGAGCIAAAGIGGYLAQRVSPVPLDAVEASGAEVTVPVPPESQMSVPPEVEPATPEPPVSVNRTVPAEPAPAEPRARRTEPRPEPVAVPPPPPAPIVTVPAGLPASSAPEAELPPAPERVAPVVMDDELPVAFIELTVDADSVIGIRLDTAVSSGQAEVEDRVAATVTRDVTVDGRTAIPAGARLEGVVTLVEAGGRFKEKARIGIQFDRLLLTDASVMRIQTEPIYRDGKSPTGEATSKIGASAVVGAILGGILGGKKGATIGGAAGAAGGTAAVARGGPNDVTVEVGTPLTVRLVEPIVLLVERHP